MGYSTLTIADHLDEQWAPVPAMVSAAEATTTLRIGALVLCNDYRHPVVVAKEAASIDILSGGRLELGLGAGWMLTDYEQAGIAYDSPGTRVSRLAEAVTVVKGLFADGPAALRGRALPHRRARGRCPSRCRRRGRRSCSAAAPGACSASPAGRPTSWP